METTRIKVPSFHLVDYIKNDCPNPKRVILLLHGYGEKAQKIFKRLIEYLPEDSLVIAPNGPFPLPVKTEDGYKLSFAWYFFDPIKDKFFIDYELPSELLKNFYQKLELPNLPLTIIGYSQGGYLAPLVGAKIPQTNHVIGINCRFRYDKLGQDINFKLDGIHGKSDDVVDPIRALESFEILKKRGIKGNFYYIENQGHLLTEPIKEKIQELLKD
jgi:predicted esterase